MQQHCSISSLSIGLIGLIQHFPRSDQNSSDQIRTDQIRSDQIREEHIRTGRIIRLRSDQIRPGKKN
eukprot:3714773-Amphidinium_carterae.1